MITKSRRIALAALLLGALAIVQTGCGSVQAGRQDVPELLKPVKKAEDYYEVKRGSIVQKLSGIGIFVPASTTYYQYSTSGRVAKVYVEPGDTVRPGDVLVQLYTSDLEKTILDQKLVVAKAEDNLEQVKQKQDPEQLRLAIMNQQVEQLKLDKFEQDLKDRTLVADRSGVVTFVDLIKPGDSIAAYRDLIGVSDPKDLQFMFTSSRSNDLYMIDRDMAVEVLYDGVTYTGKVTMTPRTAPSTNSIIESDKYTRSLTIKLDRYPPDAVMGSQGEMTIVTASRDNTLIIPRVGLRSYQGRNYVHIRDGESRKEVDVLKGIETATEVEIRQGLQEGQQIILNN